MGRSLIIALLVLAAVGSSQAAKETVEELAVRAEAARPEDRPGLYIEIAERQLKNAGQLFGENKNDQAVNAIRDIATFAEKAHDAAMVARSRLKGTEIALRKMAAKLRDLKRTLSFEDQTPVQAAADHLEGLRTDLLGQMFGKKK